MSENSQQPTGRTKNLASTPKRHFRIGVGFFYFIVTILVFSRSVPYDLLHWDDDLHLLHNPHLNPVTIDSFLAIWAEPYEGLYIPLSYSFFAIEVFLTRWLFPRDGIELAPYLFHIICLLLHCANSLQIFRILKLIISDRRAACMGGLLFLLHPLQVESVAWISETRGLLSGLFALTAIYLALKVVVQAATAPSDLSHVAGPSHVELTTKETICKTGFQTSSRTLVLATICFLLSLLAKPTSVVSPLIVVILTWGFFPYQLRRLFKWLWIWFVIAFVMAVINRNEQAELIFESPLWFRPFIAGDSLTFYLGKFLSPYPLMFDYGRNISYLIQTKWTYCTWLAPCALLLVICFLNHRKIWLTSYAIFIAGVLPVLGIVPFAYQYISSVADRYVYLSMLGPALALTWFLSISQKKMTMRLAYLALSLFSVLSFFQTAVWKNDDTFFGHCLKLNPRSFMSHQQLGHLLETTGNFKEAEQHFLRALSIMPEDSGINHNLGIASMRLGQTEKAFDYYQKAIEFDPNNSKSHFELATYYESHSRDKDAFHHYSEALRVRPKFSEAWLGLGNLARNDNKHEEAIRYYRLALRFKPNYPLAHKSLGYMFLQTDQIANAQIEFELFKEIGHIDSTVDYNLGLIAAKNNEIEKAMILFRSSLEESQQKNDLEQIQKVKHELTLIHNLAGAMHQENNRHIQAISQFEQAIQYNATFAPAHYNLAQSLHGTNRKAEALEALKIALTLVPENSEAAIDIKNRLELYQK